MISKGFTRFITLIGGTALLASPFGAHAHPDNAEDAQALVEKVIREGDSHKDFQEFHLTALRELQINVKAEWEGLGIKDNASGKYEAANHFKARKVVSILANLDAALGNLIREHGREVVEENLPFDHILIRRSSGPLEAMSCAGGGMKIQEDTSTLELCLFAITRITDHSYDNLTQDKFEQFLEDRMGLGHD